MAMAVNPISARLGMNVPYGTVAMLQVLYAIRISASDVCGQQPEVSIDLALVGIDSTRFDLVDTDGTTRNLRFEQGVHERDVAAGNFAAHLRRSPGANTPGQLE